MFEGKQISLGVVNGNLIGLNVLLCLEVSQLEIVEVVFDLELVCLLAEMHALLNTSLSAGAVVNISFKQNELVDEVCLESSGSHCVEAQVSFEGDSEFQIGVFLNGLPDEEFLEGLLEQGNDFYGLV